LLFHAHLVEKRYTDVKDVENWQTHIHAKIVDLQGLKEVSILANVIMKIRVMPTGVDVDLDKIKERIKEVVPENVEIRDMGVQPIAFGLKAIVVAAVAPDEGNIGEKFAEKIREIEGVESAEVESVELL